ncbi:restriction endonuclease subunit S [Pediococcus pentosaceus]
MHKFIIVRVLCISFYAWVLRKLGDIINVNSGRDYKHLNKGDIPVYGTGGYMLSVDKFLSDKNAVGIGRKGTINKPYVLYAPFWTVDTLFYTIPKTENDLFFISDIFQKINWLSKAESTGVPSLSKKTINNIKVYVPTFKEQQAIGSLFKKLDDLITLQQRKLDTLKLFKKALLQQMFPEKGKDIPKVRFNCSYEKWEKHILGDYLTIPVKERIVVKNTEDLMTVKLNLGGIVPGTNRETLSLGATNYFRRHAGQLIYGKQNFFNGSIAIVPTKLDGKATSGDVPSLNISNINVDYLFSFITRKSYWKQKEVTASGTGSKRIHEKTLQKFNIEVPKTVKEQKYIGNLFGSIDIVIKFDEKIINSFKTLKQALLQNLFI